VVTRATVGRKGILLVAAAGVLTAGIRLRHDLIISDVCPDILGFIPVCGIVLVSHVAVLGYGALLPRAPWALFYVGGLPAVALPVLGSLGELRSPNLCGSTVYDSVPDCFILASLAVLLVVFFVWTRTEQRT
jgi:hypothetical protein